MCDIHCVEDSATYVICKGLKYRNEDLFYAKIIMVNLMLFSNPKVHQKYNTPVYITIKKECFPNRMHVYLNRIKLILLSL